ncbi:hypothetical protein SAMN05660649_00705 [Desulfotomaculum arcticum]|uniref:Uncharacterized protein n=1 Tax=Desulfotruncus arcticus DSM 17038 TaxID=1121424 RepID=A0A1I2PB40_9FIRM|nr:hypothetical protein SAMN05660649_00705 [Desulfotomaculum arcticum] [Desulfotruncus arcticus DSM 17038]
MKEKAVPGAGCGVPGRLPGRGDAKEALHRTGLLQGSKLQR